MASGTHAAQTVFRRTLGLCTASLFQYPGGVPTSALKVLLNAGSSENPAAKATSESERSEVESSVFAIFTRCKMR